MAFHDISALEALNYIDNKTMLLPDIQREFRWGIRDIEKLFESILDDYPIGFCIFWKTCKDNLNKTLPNLYYFLDNYDYFNNKNRKTNDIYDKDNEYYIVLDGQQRLTTLNIALKGYYSEKKKGKGHLKSNIKSWIKRKLYYNLDFHNQDYELNDEHPIKRFLFLSDKEIKSGNYYLVGNLLKYNTKREFIDSLNQLNNNNNNNESKNDLIKLFNRLRNNEDINRGIIHYYEINKVSYDEALNIFVRVNSTGKKLAKSDLLFSTLIDNWKEGKESIDELIKVMNSKGDGFNFTRDYLMRLALVLIDKNTKLKIEAFDIKSKEEIKSNWDKIKDTCLELVDLLVSIGMSNENLTSYNATMPLAYYIYHNGQFNEDSKKEARKFLSVALSKNLFSVASDQVLTSTRKVLKDYDCKHNPFKLDIFKNIILTGNRTFNVNEKEIDYWLDNYEKGNKTYIILCLLYPNYKLSREYFHQDHCHPWVAFEHKNIKNLSIPYELEEEWRSKRNLLPNLQFLEGKENEHKNKTPLNKWIQDGNSIAYLPEKVSLELKDFDTFFSRRRELIKNKLKEIFEVNN